MNKIITSIQAEPSIVDLASLERRPHAALSELRQRMPIAQYAPRQYLVTGGQQVTSLLADARARQIRGLEFAAIAQIPDSMVARFISDFLMFANDQGHRDRRQIFARALSGPAIAAMRPRMRNVINQIVAELPQREVFDFVDSMSARVPHETIAAILGLPQQDMSRIGPWIYDISRAFKPVYPSESHHRIERATHALCDYLFAQLKLRQVAPRDDFLSALVADWSDTQAISFDSLVFQMVGILAAGAEATRCALTMLVASLLQRPLIWNCVRSDRRLIAGAVAESLRFEPPVASVVRLTTAPIDIAGFTLPVGALMRLSIMSALRDPAIYAHPDRFDIRRKDHTRLHMSFALGAHRCLGETLAVVALEESIDALLDAASGIELVSPPRLAGFCGMRQITPMHTYIP